MVTLQPAVKSLPCYITITHPPRGLIDAQFLCTTNLRGKGVEEKRREGKKKGVMSTGFHRISPDFIQMGGFLYPERGNDRDDVKVFHYNLLSWSLVIALVVISIIPNVFETRYDGNDKPLSEYVLNNFHALELHWPGLLILGFLTNHHIYNILDLCAFWNDKSARDSLLLNFRIVCSCLLPIPQLCVAVFGALKLSETGKYINLAFLSMVCVLIFVQSQVLGMSTTDAFHPRLISGVALVSYMNMTVAAVCGWGPGYNAAKISRLTAWTLNFTFYVYLIYRYSQRVNLWKICFTTQYHLRERCVAISLLIPCFCMIVLAVGNYILRPIFDGEYHANSVATYTFCTLLCCIPVLIIPERSARLNLKQIRSNLESFETKMVSEISQMRNSLDQLKNPSFLHSAFLDPLFRENFAAMTKSCESIYSNLEEINWDQTHNLSEVRPSSLPQNNQNHSIGIDNRLVDSGQLHEDRLRHVRTLIDRQMSGRQSFKRVDAKWPSEELPFNENDDRLSEGQHSSTHIAMKNGQNSDDNGDSQEYADHIITIDKKSKLDPLASDISFESNEQEMPTKT